MASGDLVGIILEYSTPESNPAVRGVRLGGSTDNEAFTIWKFKAGADTHLDLKCLLFGYDGGGITIENKWMSESATSGTVQWKGAFRRLQDDADDLDSSHAYDYNTVDDVAPAVSGYPTTADITFSDGADMDSVPDGEVFWLRITREITVGGNMSGDAQILAINILET